MCSSVVSTMSFHAWASVVEMNVSVAMKPGRLTVTVIAFFAIRR